MDGHLARAEPRDNEPRRHDRLTFKFAAGVSLHDMWEKVVLNLLSNALKYTFAGAITIALALDGERVCLKVSDTGTGIPAGELPHIFERFHRVQGSRSRTHEGTGIGLALVHELTRLHGGSIGVESRPDVGSSFTVSLPRGNAHLPTDRVSSAHALTSTATGATPFVQEPFAGCRGAPTPTLPIRTGSSHRPQRSARPPRATSRPESWLPTTTPTCATTSRGCCANAGR